ncbi:MAG: hypothetical protein ACTSR8_19375 [Promethearchaeota archaeon]
MEKNPFINENGTIISLDKLCEYSYQGINRYIQDSRSVEELQELKRWVEDVRWFCEEEFDKVDQSDEFGEMKTSLEEAFTERKLSFLAQEKN